MNSIDIEKKYKCEIADLREKLNDSRAWGDSWLDKAKAMETENTALAAKNKRLREALDTIESMATDTTHDIQGIAQAAIKEGGKP